MKSGKAITAQKPFLAKKFDQVSSIFDRSDPKKNKIKQSFTFHFLIGEKSNLIKFDQRLANFGRSDQKKSKIKQPLLFFL